MNKYFLFALSICLLIVLSPKSIQAGVVYGESVVGYDSNVRRIFGYSATWTDYEASFYYDPAVEGELYWQYDNEVPLDSGSDTGFSEPYFGYQIPAEVWLFSSSYRPVTTYSTYSNHFVRPYYVDYYGYFVTPLSTFWPRGVILEGTLVSGPSASILTTTLILIISTCSRLE